MNKRGVALIFAYVFIVILTMLGVSFLSRSVSEDRIVAKYADSIRAFWIAEAGLNQAYRCLADLPESVPFTQCSSFSNFSGGQFNVAVSMFGVIDSIGNFSNATRTLIGVFSRRPRLFENTFSVGGNVLFNGTGLWDCTGRLNVTGNMHISGNYLAIYANPGAPLNYLNATFENKQTGVDTNRTTLRIPDYNGNDIPDEFKDFVLLGSGVKDYYAALPGGADMEGYLINDAGQQSGYYRAQGQAVYIQVAPGGAVQIRSSRNADLFRDRKIVFVEAVDCSPPCTPSSPEGHSPANVEINFDPTRETDQDITIVATGNVEYMWPAQEANSRLSFISWGFYNEYSGFPLQATASRNGISYTHGNSTITSWAETGITNGNNIVNGDLIYYVWGLTPSHTYAFSPRAMNGDLPPGFEFLPGSSEYSVPQFKNWEEPDSGY